MFVFLPIENACNIICIGNHGVHLAEFDSLHAINSVHRTGRNFGSLHLGKKFQSFPFRYRISPI